MRLIDDLILTGPEDGEPAWIEITVQTLIVLSASLFAIFAGSVLAARLGGAA